MIFSIFHYFQASKSRAHMRASTIFCYEWILRTLNKVSTISMNRIFQKLIIIIEFENLLFSKISKKMKILEKFQKFFQVSKFSKSFKNLISDRRMFFQIFAEEYEFHGSSRQDLNKIGEEVCAKNKDVSTD